MIETIVSLICGSLIVYGFLLRIKTINTSNFFKETKIKLFMFLSIGIGLVLVNSEKVIHIVSNIPKGWSKSSNINY
jgi:hypothetical protein